MTSDVDVWRAANLFIKQHGDDAGLMAAQRADELLADGDVEGKFVWKRIMNAIKEIQRTEPADDEKRH